MVRLAQAQRNGAHQKAMPQPELPRFAMMVRQARQDLGLSQRALAQRAGIPIYRIEEVEQGRWPKKNYYKTLLALARALGLKPNQLDDRLGGTPA